MERHHAGTTHRSCVKGRESPVGEASRQEGACSMTLEAIMFYSMYTAVLCAPLVLAELLYLKRRRK
jgi:hypothetical protein